MRPTDSLENASTRQARLAANAADGTMTADLRADWEVGNPDLPFRDIADMETTTKDRGSRDDR
jgi:hypothetical protein